MLFSFHPLGVTSREVYREFQPSDDIFRRSGAKGFSDQRFRASTQSRQPVNTLNLAVF